MFKLIREFYGDLKKYDYDKKWMCFDFFIRQPLGYILNIIAFVMLMLQIKDRMSFVSVTMNAIYLLLWMLLLILVYIRKKYSYACYHVLLILQALYMILTLGDTGWSLVISIVVHLIFLALLFKYYYYRFDFFDFNCDKKNATPEELEKRGKIAKRAGIIFGVQILFLGTVCGISFYIQNWISEPVANIEYLSDAENPMMDINKVVGEEEAAFLEALAGASTLDEYQRVFEQNPDKLSVYTQDALYGYIYKLMSESVDYNESLMITGQEFDQLQTVINGILKTGNGCGRYLRILADMGAYHKGQIEEELRTIYKDKQAVVSLIPEYAMHVQLITLFETLIQSLDHTTGFFLQDVMQIEQLGLDDDVSEVRNDIYRIDKVCFSYKEIYGNSKETEYMLIYKENGFSGASDIYIDERISPERFLQIYYFGDVITCPNCRGNSVQVFGTYDIGTWLKCIWLEEEGYASFFDFLDEEEVTRIAKELKSEAQQRELAKQKLPYYEMYLLWTGEPCTKEDGSLCPVQKLSDIPLENLEQNFTSLHHYMGHVGFDYEKYNILDEYYLKDLN